MLVKIADRTETSKIVFQDEPLAYVAHRNMSPYGNSILKLILYP